MNIIILAAGKGTRMQSRIPKVMHHIAGAPMIAHVMQSVLALSPARMVIVAGHGAQQVERAATHYGWNADIVIQDRQLGTGHAVLQTKNAFENTDEPVLIAYADTPNIRPETLAHMQDTLRTCDIVILGFHTKTPGRYGRIIAKDHDVERIVEFKDATEDEKAITLCNSGLIATRSGTLFDLLNDVGNDNAAGEYYLTDIIALANARGQRTSVVLCDEEETMGINTRAELACAEQVFQDRARARALENAVTLQAPQTVMFSYDTIIKAQCVIEPYVVFGTGVTLEENVTIRAFSHLEGCHVHSGASIGPYARVRPGACIEQDAHIGNFVEIKNAVIENGAKVNHLSYIGDAHIGSQTNIGAGTITCNYDGVNKHKTIIGKRAFIGSDTMLIAPVSLGDDTITASGSVITADVPDGALAIARAKQTNKPNLAQKIRSRAKATRDNKG